MKRRYESGAEKRAKRRKAEQTAAISSQKIDQFFHLQSNSNFNSDRNPKSLDSVTTEAGPSNEDESTLLINDENNQPQNFIDSVPSTDNISVGLKDVLTCESPEKSSETCTVSMTDIDEAFAHSDDFSSDVEARLFNADRLHPTDRGHFPETIHSTALKEMIISHGPCRPSNADKRIQKHFAFYTKGNLKIEREWLCYSPTLEKAYCEVCWLFGNRNNHAFRTEWVRGVTDDHKKSGFLKRIKTHEQSETHISAARVYQQWKSEKRMDEQLASRIQEETNVWRQVISRVIDIILTMSSMCIALRGHREKLDGKECEGGNFLSIVNMLAKYDPILQNILSLESRSTRYLSPVVQNELIELMHNALRSELVARIQAAPFFSIIADTTSDVSRVDQLSIVVRWMEDVKIHETFLGFLRVTDATAGGLTKLITEFLKNIGLDLKKLRGQGYDGASVMSGHIHGVQHLMRGLTGGASAVPFVHCAAHNLNLVVNDAVKATIQSTAFFDTIAEVYVFFASSLSRWAELAFSTETAKMLTLKKVCPTRWSSRVNSVRALKNRYLCILKVLCKISLTSKSAKERADANGLRKKIETFEFLVFIVFWERLLLVIDRASRELQSSEMDLGRASILLQMAFKDLKFLRNDWKSVVSTASAIAKNWSVEAKFVEKRVSKIKRFYDELSNDERLTNPEEAFRAHVFYPAVDTALQQLDSRFHGQHAVCEAFAFLMPANLAAFNDGMVNDGIASLINMYPLDFNSADDIQTELRQFSREFKKELEKMSSVKSLHALLCESKLLASMPETATAISLFLTLPVTVATAERSFSKLKIIKSFLRSSMTQQRLDGLSLLAIEHKEAKFVNWSETVKTFASKNARRRSKFS